MRHNRRVTSDEIRETFLSYFEARGHRRLPSASLVPATFDPSVLLTTAGMHPLKPLLRGHREAAAQPAHELPEVLPLDRHRERRQHRAPPHLLRDARQLLDRRLLQGGRRRVRARAVDRRASASPRTRSGSRSSAATTSSTSAPTRRRSRRGAPSASRSERIVLLGREDNFWQSGPTGPCGPCSELYLDRGPEWGGEHDRPGDDTERFLEYWNLVFMQYDQDPVNWLTPLPSKNIDTGLGLNRMALIQQDAPTIFETDQFAPLMALGRELASRTDDERALRILADHSRAATFLIADGVVPSNEDRGYILRRVMRRAMQQGHRIGIERGLPPAVRRRRHRHDGRRVPRAAGAPADDPEVGARPRRRASAARSSRARGCSTTCSRAARSRARTRSACTTRTASRSSSRARSPRSAASRSTGDDEFARLMGEQRARSSAGAKVRSGGGADVVREVGAEPTEFTGYEHLEQHTTVTGLLERDGRTFVKLAESPFYAAGGGQISDAGAIECEDGDCRVVVADVVRAGDDQAVVVEPVEGELHVGERVVARVDQVSRHATACNHTATHLLHAALRNRLGAHVHQAGSYVGPDKLRFDFTHTERLYARGPPRDRGPGQRVDHAQRPGAPDHDDARRGQAPRRDRAVRREVRRHRAHGRDRRRLLLARALRRHARALDRRDRAVQDPVGGLERLERAPHRGRHRPRGRPAPARARRGPAPRSRTRSASPPTTRSRRSRRCARRSRRRRSGRASPRSIPRRWPSARARWTARRCSPRSSTRRTPRR